MRFQPWEGPRRKRFGVKQSTAGDWLVQVGGRTIQNHGCDADAATRHAENLQEAENTRAALRRIIREED